MAAFFYPHVDLPATSHFVSTDNQFYRENRGWLRRASAPYYRPVTYPRRNGCRYTEEG